MSAVNQAPSGIASPPGFIPGTTPLFRIVENPDDPYAAQPGDFVICGGTCTITLPNPAPNNAYVAVKYIGNGTETVSIVGTIDNSAGMVLQHSEESVWVVWSEPQNTWYIVAAYEGPGEFEWTWANAVTRLGTAAVADQVGAIGYQQDIELKYELLAIGGGQPNRWGALPDPKMGPPRILAAVPGAVSIGSVGMGAALAFGTLTARTSSGASVAEQLGRIGVVTLAVAGSLGSYRAAGATCYEVAGGLRYRSRGVLQAVCASMRWLMGLGTAPITNVDPITLQNLVGIGRGNGEANVQLYHADAAGNGQQIDLGPNFPANTALTAYELELYTFSGVTWAYAVRALNTNYEVSGLLTTEIPATTATPGWMWWSSNNADGVAISLDVAELVYAQRTR